MTTTLTPELEVKINCLRSNREHNTLVHLRNEIARYLADGKLDDARGAVEELFVLASSNESLVLEILA
jgi:hypothetical protein